MLKEYVAEFAKYKKLGIQTLAQLSDAALNVSPAAEANSIGVIVRHLHGNLISRFTDFMTTDGEKEWRDRAAEFAEMNYARAEVEAYWTAAWTQLETVLAGLSDSKLATRLAPSKMPLPMSPLSAVNQVPPSRPPR